MNRLPIPPLTQTLTKLLDITQPILSIEEIIISKDAITVFKNTSGQTIQKSLQYFATEQYPQNKSWLSDNWLNSYLRVRNPLLLSSNVTFEINWADFAEILDKAVDVILRQTQLHINYLSGKIAPIMDSRGNKLCMQQWAILRGGIRCPKKDIDHFYLSSDDICNRHISILWKNQHIIFPVTDKHGLPYARKYIKSSLQSLFVTLNNSPKKLSFTNFSHLGSKKVAAYLDLLLEKPVNQATYKKLRDSWFVLSLIQDTQDDNEQLFEKLTFNPSQCWCYKPITFQLNMDNGYLAVNIEHSTIDGATLHSMLAHTLSYSTDTISTNEEKPIWQLAHWAFPNNWQSLLTADLTEYKNIANNHKIAFCRTDISALKATSRKINHDALQQFALAYAQLRTFASIRNTYEAVDVRNFIAGRTEALRPLSLEVVNLAQAMLDNQATPTLLEQAFATHKRRIIDCKTGHAIDRHLLALRWQSPNDVFFTCPAIKALSEDFLSTSSVGDQRIIRRFAFAPTLESGFGVNYSYSDTHYCFCVSANIKEQPALNNFSLAISEGIEQLITLVCQS